jgi:hypothetical protein
MTEQAKAATAQRKALAAQLNATGDPRATAAATLLTRRTPPIDELRRMIGGPAPDPTLAELMALQAITPLALARVEALTAELAAAADAVEQLDTPAARSAHDLAEILRAALRSHARHVDVASGTCPVCGTDGVLGGDWAERAQVRLVELDHQAAELAAALDRAGCGDRLAGERRPLADRAAAVSTTAARLADAVLLLNRPAVPRASVDGVMRGVAVLLRQGLEAALEEHWARRGTPEAAQASMRHQLIALSVTWSADPQIAADIEVAWYGLTHACHGGVGRPMPTAGELRSVAVVIQALLLR